MQVVKNRDNHLAKLALACLLVAGNTVAAVSEEEAARLGNELTPMGAERAGNGDEIPEWTGGLQEPPSGYQDDGLYVDPFPDDEELYRIGRSNLEEHKHRLSPGQVAMIERYENYFIPVFQTRRTAVFPDEVMEQTRQNATQVSLVPSGNGLENYESGTPFPIPQNGIEAIFNHTTRYRGTSLTRNIAKIAPQPNGDFNVIRMTEDLSYPKGLADYQPEDHRNILFYFRQTTTSPSRLSGNVLLVHETIDQVEEGRIAWVYSSGQRRVRRAPQAAYDSPGIASDGQNTADNLDMFNGAPDRYDWELKGKKEMYIPYNAYRLLDRDLSYGDIIQPGHVDQSLTRYELHRVWHVRATLKEGERHVYAQRDFYIDEDSWQIAVVDHYDGRGELWRVAEAHKLQAYDQGIVGYAFETIYDLLSGRYLVNGLTNQESNPYTHGVQRRSSYFTPSALRRSGR